MSQKPFEHIENKIREAAEKREPSFNENAWKQMELLLDKEDRKKRRFFIWWRIGLPLLLLALVAGGTLFLFQKNSKSSKSLSPLQKSIKSKKDKPVIEKPSFKEVSIISPSNKTSIINQTSKSKLITANKVAQIKPAIRTNTLYAHNNKAAQKALNKLKLYKKGTAAINISDISIDDNNQLPVKENTAIVPLQENTQKLEAINETSAIVEAILSDSSKSHITVKNEKSIKNENKPTITDKPSLTNKVSTARFYLLAAGGADIAGVKFLSFENSTLQSRYGIAFGYLLNKKFSVQAGVYAARKIYTGGPDDYHAKQGSYWSTVKLNKVDASCLVYDIPISIRYEVMQKRQFNFYTVVGLSSFIMKKEDYNYYYTAYNTDREKKYSYTGNQHLFSNLLISAGLEKSISGVLSLQAEPYLSIPIKGVGDGMVKLYSAGLMLSIKYKPIFKLGKKKTIDKK